MITTKCIAQCKNNLNFYGFGQINEVIGSKLSKNSMLYNTKIVPSNKMQKTVKQSQIKFSCREVGTGDASTNDTEFSSSSSAKPL